MSRAYPDELLLAARRCGHAEGMGAALQAQAGETPAVFLARLAATLMLPVLDDFAALVPAFELIPYADCARRGLLLARRDGVLLYALADPFDLALQSWLAERLGSLSCRWHLAHHEAIKGWLVHHEAAQSAIAAALPALSENSRTDAPIASNVLDLLTLADDDSPVVRLVNSTLYDALRLGASDIHFECAPNGLTLRYRLDGVLEAIATLPGGAFAEQAVSRIKVMAELDIAERRIPQDGRFRLVVQGREIDFRVSIMPRIAGEDVVVRVLDKRALADRMEALRLDLLGFDDVTLAAVRRLARAPHGMLLVTGPTGSGKTTTLYAALSEINDGRDKIVTIEDPVEYRIPGVLQVPVNEKKGLTFSRGLRSLLRHDPDKILVGEIRDAETAQIAVQSALTGHLVFTSVHANNVFDVLGRFLHMGIEPYSFVGALNGVLAQRLLRLVCPHCAMPHQPSEAELNEARLDATTASAMRFVYGAGCAQCRGTGYKGRYAIGELLRLTDEVREMIVARAPARTIRATAQAQGTRLLRDAALALAAAGRTSLEEANRATLVD